MSRRVVHRVSGCACVGGWARVERLETGTQDTIYMFLIFARNKQRRDRESRLLGRGPRQRRTFCSCMLQAPARREPAGFVTCTMKYIHFSAAWSWRSGTFRLAASNHN